MLYLPKECRIVGYETKGRNGKARLILTIEGPSSSIGYMASEIDGEMVKQEPVTINRRSRRAPKLIGTNAPMLTYNPGEEA